MLKTRKNKLHVGLRYRRPNFRFSETLELHISSQTTSDEDKEMIGARKHLVVCIKVPQTSTWLQEKVHIFQEVEILNKSDALGRIILLYAESRAGLIRSTFKPIIAAIDANSDTMNKVSLYQEARTVVASNVIPAILPRLPSRLSRFQVIRLRLEGILTHLSEYSIPQLGDSALHWRIFLISFETLAWVTSTSPVPMFVK